MENTIEKSAGKWWIGITVSFLIAFLFTYTEYWQFALAAGVIGGWFCPGIFRGAIFACLGTTLAWALYVYLQGAWVLLDQVGDLVIGGKGNGFLLAAVVAAIGGIMGALGGAMGGGIRRTFSPGPVKES